MIKLKKFATSDENYLFDLQNIDNVRLYAKNSNIPTIKEHNQWFSRFINDIKSHGFIIYSNNIKCGIVRINNSLNKDNVLCGEISIIVAPKFWGKGIAAQAITLAIDKKLSDLYIAVINKANKASCKLFKKLDFIYKNDLENNFFKMEYK